MKDSEDFDVKWQVWARRGEAMTELKPELDYPATFRFTSDSQWLVRMQKAGAGYQDLYLYHVKNGAFVSATSKPISDLAWRSSSTAGMAERSRRPTSTFSPPS
jgi:hypothetical protein